MQLSFCVGIQKAPYPKAKAIYKALEIINSDLSRHIHLKQLAKAAGTNECSLKKGFRTLLNISVYQYLLQCRMNKAQHLLLYSGLKQSEIADLCGYESHAGFVTAFRKYFGTPPGIHRKHYRYKIAN